MSNQYCFDFNKPFIPPEVACILQRFSDEGATITCLPPTRVYGPFPICNSGNTPHAHCNTSVHGAYEQYLRNIANGR